MRLCTFVCAFVSMNVCVYAFVGAYTRKEGNVLILPKVNDSFCHLSALLPKIAMTSSPPTGADSYDQTCVVGMSVCVRVCART